MGAHDPYDPRNETIYWEAGQLPLWQCVYLDGEDVTDLGSRIAQSNSWRDAWPNQ